MIVAPETPVTLVFTDKATRDEIHREETTAELIDGCVTRVSIMFNALTMGGGVLWRHPRTGQTYPRGVSWCIEMVHPDTGELVTAVPSR